jgi:hypothetical protein
MAVPETIPIPLHLPRDEATALAQFTKRIDHGTVAGFASPTVTYDDCPEADTMWSGLCMLRAALAEAGFAPR